MAEPLFLATSAVSGSHPVKVSPTVVLSILDHYVRRNDDQDRVIGTLLGVVNEAGEIEVRSSFPVPHSEKEDTVLVNMDFHKNMYELHRKVNPKESIIGWYASGNELTYADLLIHDFYSAQIRTLPIGKELPQPMHLTVDTALEGNRMSIRAYTSATVGIATPEGPQGFMFVPVPCDIKVSEGERIGMEVLARAKGQPVAVASELENLERSVHRLEELLATVQTYVADVVAGRRPASVSVGRFLLDSVAAVPKIDQAKFEQIFNTNLQDLLMVVYLSTLTRTQLALAERLQFVV